MKTQLTISFITLFILNLISFSQAHKGCGHHLEKDLPNIKLNLHGNENPEITKLRYLQTTWQPIRIYLDYTHLDSQTTIDSAKRAGIKQVVEQTKLMYESLLKVKRLTSKLFIQSCGSAQISATVKSPGVDADLILFPHFEPTYSGSIEAAATSCAQDQTTGRPLVGYIKYGIDAFNVQKTNWIEYYTDLTFHEISHILVFNDILWESFIDSSGNTIAKTAVTGNQTINGISRLLIISPKVTAAAQAHFGCSTLKGVELENQGGEGTSGNHWEMRTMLGDYIIGESFEDVVLSEISLALFEDSGWYQTNKFTGGQFRHGKNQGCDFVLNKCVISDKTNFPNDFCTENTAYSCTSGRFTKGSCYMTSAPSNLDSNYNYFSSGLVGGTANADYCPVTRSSFDNGIFFKQGCASGVSDLPTGLNEIIGVDSACFYSSIKDSTNISHQTLPNFTICYKFACDDANRKINVVIGTQTVSCPTAGGPITTLIFLFASSHANL